MNYPDYHLTHQQGQQIREVLNRYLEELYEQKRGIEIYDNSPTGDSFQVRKDIDYVNELVELFD